MRQLWLAVVAEGTAIQVPRAFEHGSIVLDEAIHGRRYLGIVDPPLADAPSSSAESIVLRAGPDAGRVPDDPREDPAPTIRIDRRSGDLEVSVMLTSVVQLFHARHHDSLYLCTDPRVIRTSDMALDAEAVYCLLQFGALIAPLAIWDGMRRFLPGRVTRFRGRDLSMSEETIPYWSTADPRSASAEPLDARAQEILVAERFDSSLERCSPDRRPIVLYSGGVDSGLMAARARQLGWNDTVLMNYQTGPGDPESELAQAMANHLGLRFERVTDDPGSWARFLGQIGASYVQPQGDYSTVPIQMAVQRALNLSDARRVVLDGSGADGVFGGFPRLPRWRRLYRMPLLFRLAGAAAFRLRGTWAEISSNGRKLAAMRESCQMPILLASVAAENALLGVAYRAEPSIRHALFERTLAWVREQFSYSRSVETDGEIRGFDLAHIVCNMTAQKSAPAFFGTHLDCAFPFLDPKVVRLGFEQAIDWPEQRESKAVLKRLLAEAVPREMVYRPKSGPKPPITAQLASPVIAEMLRAHVLGDANPLRPYLEMKVVREMVDRATRGVLLPFTTYNFLWTVFFTALWFDQLERE